MSSPSRTASQAFTTRSTSVRFSSLWMAFSCLRDFASRGFSLNASGTIGRSAMRHFLKRSSYSSGWASSTRWPTAHVITVSSDSRCVSPFFANEPGRAAAMSRPTDGFSAMMRVLLTRNNIAKRSHGTIAPVKKAPLLTVDGDNLAHRAFHALPQSIADGQGKPANAIIGFTNMLLTVWDREEPRTVFVAWDTVGTPTYRNELLPQYQSGRDFPKVLTDQLDRLPELVGALGWATAKQEGFEADDFLAAAVQAEEESRGTALVLTTDRDLFQLASDRTTILHPRRGA